MITAVILLLSCHYIPGQLHSLQDTISHLRVFEDLGTRLLKRVPGSHRHGRGTL